MKKILTLIIMALVALTASAFANDNGFLANDNARQALYGALDQAAPVLKNAPFGKNPVAILPLKKGHTILAGRVKNLLVNAGFVCVEGKEDPMWDEILKEIEWDERKEDILDPETLAKFGKLKAAKILFQCDIRIVDENADRVYAEIELRATDIATKQILWGNTFAYRYYVGKNVQGIIALDNDLREILGVGFDEAKGSLNQPQIAEKLNHVKTITIVPLSGDIDSYMTGLATNMISQTKYSAKNPFIPSLTQIRAAGRDGSLDSDAVMYGAVRALHKTNPVEKQVGKKFVTTYEVFAEVQLFIEDAKTGNILWSKTVSRKKQISSEREMTPEELKKFQQEKLDAVPGEITEDIADNWKSYLKVIGLSVGGLILLLLAFIGIKAFISYRNVR